MKVHYKATLDSSSKMLDGLPIQLPVGTKVNCKIRDVQPLCANANEAEKLWYKEEVERNTVDGK